MLLSDANGVVREPRLRLTRFAWWWLGALWVLVLAQWLLGQFDNTTLLSGQDDGPLTVCFLITGLAAMASAFVGYSQSAGRERWRWIAAVLIFGMTGVLGTLLFTDTVTNIVLGKLYFPPDRTETFHALLPIGRAYRAESRFGDSWVMQPTPLWTNIDIAQADYDFMVAGRRVHDVRDEPRDVPSRGIFCARVTMQRSGDALRVLHAGRETLPEGSVVRCPPAARGQAYLEVRELERSLVDGGRDGSVRSRGMRVGRVHRAGPDSGTPRSGRSHSR